MQKENLEANRPVNLWRIIGWGGLALLLLAPLVAMQFSDEVDWDKTDFIVAGAIFAIVGGFVDLAVRASSSWFYRIGAFFAIFSGFIVVWVNLAVGMIGNEDNPVNLLFIVVVLGALAGAMLARFRSEGMARAMFVAGGAQALIAAVFGILGTDMRGGIFSLGLAMLWILSGALFRASRG